MNNREVLLQCTICRAVRQVGTIREQSIQRVLFLQGSLLRLIVLTCPQVMELVQRMSNSELFFPKVENVRIGTHPNATAAAGLASPRPFPLQVQALRVPTVGHHGLFPWVSRSRP